MTAKNVLGRGVGALLPEEGNEEEQKYFYCDIEKISPNPSQPRSYFDEEKLRQLLFGEAKNHVIHSQAGRPKLLI